MSRSLRPDARRKREAAIDAVVDAAAKAGAKVLETLVPDTALPDGPPGRFVVPIPGFQPVKLNVLLGSHWAVAARRKKADAAVIAAACRLAGVTRAKGRRRVSLAIILGPGQRAGDPDAFWKSTLDACVKAGALVDDNRQGVELMPVQFERSSGPATRITLEDIP